MVSSLVQRAHIVCYLQFSYCRQSYAADGAFLFVCCFFCKVQIAYLVLSWLSSNSKLDLFSLPSKSGRRLSRKKLDANIDMHERFTLSLPCLQPFTSCCLHPQTKQSSGHFENSAVHEQYNTLSFLRQNSKFCCFHFQVQPDRTVNKGDIVSLKCTGYRYRASNITGTKVSDNLAVTFPLGGKQHEGDYRCTANNGC